MEDGKQTTPPNQSRNFRLNAGLTQEEVAFLLNIKNVGRISEWENGTSNPSIENLFKLSLIYSTLPDQLYYPLRLQLANDIAVRKDLLEEKKKIERRLDKDG